MAAAGEDLAADVAGDQGEPLRDPVAEPSRAAKGYDRHADLAVSQWFGLLDAVERRPVDAERAQHARSSAEGAQVFVGDLASEHFRFGHDAFIEPGQKGAFVAHDQAFRHSRRQRRIHHHIDPCAIALRL